MKRYAANKIYLSQTVSFSNAVLEIADDNSLVRTDVLSDVSELHSTPFFNGIIVPYSSDWCKANLTDNLTDSLKRIFNTDTFLTGDTISSLTLISGPKLLSQGDTTNIQIKSLK